MTGERSDKGGGDGFDAGGKVVVGGCGEDAVTGVFIGDGGGSVVEPAMGRRIDERETNFVCVIHREDVSAIFGDGGIRAVIFAVEKDGV